MVLQRDRKDKHSNRALHPWQPVHVPSTLLQRLAAEREDRELTSPRVELVARRMGCEAACDKVQPHVEPPEWEAPAKFRSTIWDVSITGQAMGVMPYCERPVRVR